MSRMYTYEKIEKEKLKEVCDANFDSQYYKHYEKLFADAINANCEFYYYNQPFPFILIVLKTNIDNIINTTPYELFGFGFLLFKAGNIVSELIIKPNSDTIYRIRPGGDDIVTYNNFSLDYMIQYAYVNNESYKCIWCSCNIKDTDSQKIWLELRNPQNPVEFELGCKNCVDKHKQDKIAHNMGSKIRRII